MRVIKKKSVFVSMLCALLCCNLMAQEVDLSAQRSEDQNISRIKMKSVKLEDWSINPTPQKITFKKNLKYLNVEKGFSLKDKHGKFADDLNFISLNPKGVKLSIDFGEKISSKNCVKNVSGAYVLRINNNGVSIVAYDERGAFYAIQTLRQLLENPFSAGKLLPQYEISDYPDLPNRGVVEGFYGTPWSHEVRMSLIDFYGRFKMNSYLYGPKDDPYHSSPNWRLPYPEKEAANIRELVERCNRNRVDFIWAIHPGKDIKWNEEDYKNLVKKFNDMYALGVRHFAIFFDDIEGEGTNPVKQTELLNRLTDDFVKAKGDVSPLTVCPTDYSGLWANPSPKGSLAIYGEKLNTEIKVFWTGDYVCSNLTKSTLEFINSRIKRPAFYWWNYPVTDYARSYLLQGPVYGLETSLTAEDVCGLVSNPMEHGEASKLALYGVADYTWNISSYDANANWERALNELMPKAKDAYRTFAIHSCDTETGYRRDESWETETFTLENWNDTIAKALENEFAKIENAYALIKKGCENKQLIEELRPWLVEFEKLGIRGKRAVELARMYHSKYDKAELWNKYVQNIMSNDDRKNFEAHKSGTMKLQPFYENIMDDIAHNFLKDLIYDTPTDYKGISSFRNSNTILPKLMLDKDTNSYYTSAASQKLGDWIGVDLRDIRDVHEIKILQGRNSIDDVDYFDHAVLEYSLDGKNWNVLSAKMKNTYIINWKGESVKARYVRLKRLDSKRSNYASVRTFDINPMRVDDLNFELSADDIQGALDIYDNNLATSYIMNNSSISFGVTTDTKGYILLMNKLVSPLTCTLFDEKGNVISEMMIDNAYFQIDLPDKNVKSIKIEGSAEIFEIISIDPLK